MDETTSDLSPLFATKRSSEEIREENIKRMCMFKHCEVGIKISDDYRKISKYSDTSSVIIGAVLNDDIENGIHFITFGIEHGTEYNICIGYENETTKEVVVINNKSSYLLNSNGMKTKCKNPIRFDKDGNIEIVYIVSGLIPTMYVLNDNILHEIFKMKKPITPFVGITHKGNSIAVLDYRIDYSGKIKKIKFVNDICGLEDIGWSSYINTVIQCLICNKTLKDEICQTDYTKIPNSENSKSVSIFFSKIINNISRYGNYEELHNNLLSLKDILNRKSENICDCYSFLNNLIDNLNSDEIKKYTLCEYKEDSNYNVSTDFLVIKISFNTYKYIYKYIVILTCFNSTLRIGCLMK